MAGPAAPQPAAEIKNAPTTAIAGHLNQLMEKRIMPSNTKPAMIAVPQPSRHLAHAYWDILEIQLMAAMLSAAEATRKAGAL
jgi:hypothetical protein